MQESRIVIARGDRSGRAPWSRSGRKSLRPTLPTSPETSTLVNREISQLRFFFRVLGGGPGRVGPPSGTRQVPQHPGLDHVRVLHGQGRRPQAAGVGGHQRALARRPEPGRATEGHPARWSSNSWTTLVRASCEVLQRARRRGRAHRRLRDADGRAEGERPVVLRQGRLPGADASRLRPGAAVPVHLEHEPEPGGHPPPRRRDGALRPGESAEHASQAHPGAVRRETRASCISSGWSRWWRRISPNSSPAWRSWRPIPSG